MWRGLPIDRRQITRGSSGPANPFGVRQGMQSAGQGRSAQPRDYSPPEYGGIRNAPPNAMGGGTRTAAGGPRYDERSATRDRKVQDFSFGGQFKRASTANDASALGLRSSRYSGGAGRAGRSWGSVTNSGPLRVREPGRGRGEPAEEDSPGLSGLGMSQVTKDNMAGSKKSWVEPVDSAQTRDRGDADQRAAGAPGADADSERMEETTARLAARLQKKREQEDTEKKERSEFFQTLKEGDCEMHLCLCILVVCQAFCWCFDCMHRCRTLCVHVRMYVWTGACAGFLLCNSHYTCGIIVRVY
jgi:hypothetical protein